MSKSKRFVINLKITVWQLNGGTTNVYVDNQWRQSFELLDIIRFFLILLLFD
jgi:hypothetical protein